MGRLEEFFDAYAEQSLSEHERNQLCAWLGESEANVDQFVRESSCGFAAVCRGGTDKSPHRRDGCEGTSRSICKSAVPSYRPRQLGASLRDSPPRRRLRAILALAASVALAVTAATWHFSRPKAIAQLTQVSADAKWAGAATKAAVGSLLNEGQRLQLVRGKVRWRPW